MSKPKTPNLDHLDPDELIKAGEAMKARMMAEAETVKKALDNARNDPAKAKKLEDLEELREIHRNLFQSCEKDGARAADREKKRFGMRGCSSKPPEASNPTRTCSRPGSSRTPGRPDDSMNSPIRFPISRRNWDW